MSSGTDLTADPLRRAQQALEAVETFQSEGRPRAAQRSLETAMSYYIEAGLDPDWFEDGGLGSARMVRDVAQTRLATPTELVEERTGQRSIVLTQTPCLRDAGTEFIVADPSAFETVDP